MRLGRKGKFALWVLFVFSFIAAGITASIAWFDEKTNFIEPSVTGSVVEEYFHTEKADGDYPGYVGDGSAEKPFVITRPIHYYHMVEFFQRLSKLSVSGVEHKFGSDYLHFQVGFDLDHDSSTPNQVYDYDDNGLYKGSSTSPALCRDLNMSYYSGNNALMPIGTNEVPFIGSFDGGSAAGIKITNLNIRCQETVIVKNNEGEEVSTLRKTSDIGVFGYLLDSVTEEVDGEDVTYSTNIHDAVFDGLTIDLSDVANPVSSSVSNSSHVNAHNDTAYVGYIVGHVHSYINYDGSTNPITNASPLHNVYVNNSKIQGGAGVVSKFGYIGMVDTIDENDVSNMSLGDQIDELAEVADGYGQGGSMNMADMYFRLRYYYRSMLRKSGGMTDNATESDFTSGVFSSNTYTGHTTIGSNTDTNKEYAWKVNRSINEEGEVTASSNNATTPYMLLHSNMSDENDKKLGTVALWNRKRALNNNEAFLYLMGGQWASDNITQYRQHIVSKISSDGTNFLSINGTGTTDFYSAGEASASVWLIPDCDGAISTTYNSQTIYLRNNNGSLQITTSSSNATVWNVSNTNNFYSITSGAYQLLCSNQGIWSLSQELSILGHKLRDNNGHYIGASKATGQADLTVVDSSDAVIWNYNRSETNPFRTNEPTQRTLRSISSGIKIYSPSSSAGNPVTLNGANSFPISGAKIQGIWSGKTYYLFFDGSKWTRDRTSYTNMYSDIAYSEPNKNLISAYKDIVYGPETETASKNGMIYDSSNTSIIPLNVKEDGENTVNDKSNYYAVKKNNGYLISGSSYNGASTFDGMYQSNVRVSGYPISRIVRSYTDNSNTLFNIRTIGISGDTLSDRELNNDEKNTALYTKSIEKLGQTLNGSEYVYGLHFMDSSISKDKLVKSKYAVINGAEKNNYDLPVDSIDFNLHEKKGAVNFFAGTYFNENNTFFSLHQIDRNGNDEIEDIKEILEVYSDANEDHSYVYKYSDGLYSQAYDTITNKNINLDGTVSGTDSYSPNMNLTSKPSTYTTRIFSSRTITIDDTTIGNNLKAGSNGPSADNSDTLYYFEIPLNKGEYALGSVSGKNGAYLLYLDVGTNGTIGESNATNLIANGPLFTQIGFYTDEYFINSVFNIAYIVPTGATSSTFSISVSVNNNYTYNLVEGYTCFDIVIINTTGQTLSLDVLLSDNNGDSTDSYLYVYSITYNGNGDNKAVYDKSDSYTGASGATSMTPTHNTTP